MRRTLWLVASDDLPMIQSAFSVRVAENERRRLAADVRKADGTERADRLRR